jgi:histidinol-phosphate aminotransferase
MPLVADYIQNLAPYPPGKPIDEVRRELAVDDPIKLASNENPLGPSPRAVEAIRGALDSLHLYPDGSAYYLKQALAQHLGVSPRAVSVGNGSNELIELLIKAFMSPPELNAVTSASSFIMYRLALQGVGKEIREAPLGKDYGFDLDAMARLVDRRTRLIFIANPNNPTGTYLSRPRIERFLAEVDARTAGDPAIVVLDEAYHEYVDAPDYAGSLELVQKRPRTVVLRTFSKAYGLAGIRCGFGVMAPELVDFLDRVRQPFNLNSLAQVAALAALGDHEFLAEVVGTNREGRQTLSRELSARGFQVVPSQANFVLADLGRESAPIYRGMMQRGVIVRPMANYGLPTTLRITVGTPAQNLRALAALDAALG